mmetsp:Transcript_36780/g.82127  ORF Transcript_36780/g.82127 Transcript_36780/m.82127 type:complete len:232 (-) Transcript_36780:285-980(-)
MMPFATMRTATRGSKYMIGCKGSGGAARSLMRTKVSSATSRLASPASRISRIALYCVMSLAPKIFLCISPSCAKKTSSSGAAGTQSYSQGSRTARSLQFFDEVVLASAASSSAVPGHCQIASPSWCVLTEESPEKSEAKELSEPFWFSRTTALNLRLIKSPIVLAKSFISDSVYRVRPSAETASSNSLPVTNVSGRKMPKRRRNRFFTTSTSDSFSPFTSGRKRAVCGVSS